MRCVSFFQDALYIPRKKKPIYTTNKFQMKLHYIIWIIGLVELWGFHAFLANETKRLEIYIHREQLVIHFELLIEMLCLRACLPVAAKSEMPDFIWFIKTYLCDSLLYIFFFFFETVSNGMRHILNVGGLSKQ